MTLSTGLASVYQQTALPAALSGKAFTLRVTMQGNTSVNQSTVGTNGVTSINNIVVTGTQGEAATDGTVCSKVKASVEPGDVEAGTKVELSCATEGATITYHTDLDSADKTYTEALVIEEDVTIYATAELEGYETSETAEFAYAVKQGAKSKEAALATTLSDGNMVALYYENNGTGSVLSQTASGKKLKGVSATAADGALAIPEDAAELTVSVDENSYYTFTCGGKYLTSGATGSSVTFADAAGDYSLWKLQKANEAKIAAEHLAAAKDLAKHLEDKSITLSIKAGEGGKAFGSVSSKEIAKAIKDQLNLDIDKKKLVLPEPIKTFGTHEVPIKLHKEVTGKLAVKVVEA